MGLKITQNVALDCFNFRFSIDIFWHFYRIFSTFYVSVARFARIDEGDFFCNFQPLCLQHQYSRSLIHPDGRLAEAKVYQATFFIASNQPFLQYTKKFAQ